MEQKVWKVCKVLFEQLTVYTLVSVGHAVVARMFFLFEQRVFLVFLNEIISFALSMSSCVVEFDVLDLRRNKLISACVSINALYIEDWFSINTLVFSGFDRDAVQDEEEEEALKIQRRLAEEIDEDQLAAFPVS